MFGYIQHEKYPEWFHKSDKEYIKRFREEKEDFHSDELIIHWRDSIRKIHENPNLRIKYGSGLDSICKKCDKKELCSDKNHWAYKSVKKSDAEAIKKLPELELGKVYDGYFLRKLSKKGTAEI